MPVCIPGERTLASIFWASAKLLEVAHSANPSWRVEMNINRLLREMNFQLIASLFCFQTVVTRIAASKSLYSISCNHMLLRITFCAYPLQVFCFFFLFSAFWALFTWAFSLVASHVVAQSSSGNQDPVCAEFQALFSFSVG